MFEYRPIFGGRNFNVLLIPDEIYPNASVSKKMWKLLDFSDFLIDDLIHDVIYLMNLGNKCKITIFIIFSKSYVFIIT